MYERRRRHVWISRRSKYECQTRKIYEHCRRDMYMYEHWKRVMYGCLRIPEKEYVRTAGDGTCMNAAKGYAWIPDKECLRKYIKPGEETYMNSLDGICMIAEEGLCLNVYKHRRRDMYERHRGDIYERHWPKCIPRMDRRGNIIGSFFSFKHPCKKTFSIV